ncbi:phosphoenolpyruvate carboxykinase (GTP) [Syntrophotalea acetylenivorans]|uniref:phosphoenolpyruvate carboxykinase (GTP) n=1 Tax=Syntrophotalea acetylenivorans TaxID=1842532 RepID=UPI000A5DA3E0|nr:phosphoenolpyruvate carboxykinase (GTP) [Syntrophotalea acetylenivorans]
MAKAMLKGERGKECADSSWQLLTKRLDVAGLAKVAALGNKRINQFLAEAIELCNPDQVLVYDDSIEDAARIRAKAMADGEERPLAMAGNTVHFDGYINSRQNDQARDKEHTRYLVPAECPDVAELNSIERQEGLTEIQSIMRNIMAGKEMLVRFFCLGPTASPFSILCVQITDSAYVAHSEDLLYRPGYEQFRHGDSDIPFFAMLHSAGRLENGVSIDSDRRRIYIDIVRNLVYCANSQYAGNTVGLKKLALRLAIRKAEREGWLAEHMFLMGVHGPAGRVTYFSGAYPSACGKTSTALLQKETVVGDDLAYIRAIDGQARAVNVERGIFGIIEDLNEDDDPVLFRALNTVDETIFNNVLISDGKPYWNGMGRTLPKQGVNYAGRWRPGLTDCYGEEIAASYRGNARFTLRLNRLKNLDPKAEEPAGVPLGGIIFGGRDSDTAVPVLESFDWQHGVITFGAALESESTAATHGAQGVRKFNPMAILDFLSIPLGRYLHHYLDFSKQLDRPPQIFATNYWLTDERGNYLNEKCDKAVWLKWMELRVHGECTAVRGPTGFLPRYDDLANLFHQVLDKDYSRQQYARQFAIRISQNLSKIKRIVEHYRGLTGIPQIVFSLLEDQRKRLIDLQKQRGDMVSPLDIL